ncbi:MAG: non-hydrolyzing UDP-N-acetylglucosamine 2-epimerase [Terriglobia bacterium]
MRTILSFFGTRPEAVKLALVIRELRGQSGRLVSKVCVTAQHRQMLDQVLTLFGIEPDYDLNIMEENQSPSQVAAATLCRLESLLEQLQPDWLLVQGDTTTVAAASLAAFFARVRVAHVEAGLRTQDKWRPFPEEINRRIAGVIADLHFAPTEQAKENLLREGVPAGRIQVTGNPVVDSLQWAAAQPFDWTTLPLPASCAGTQPDPKLILVTAHRRESFGAPLERICSALRELARNGQGRLQIVYPVHLNPNVWDVVHQRLQNVPNITLLPPLSYLPFVQLMKRSYLVLTDSGGIQEEAPALGVPALVLREVTERPEAVMAGASRMVGTDPARIVSEVLRLVEDRDEHQRMARSVSLYGDGHAARRIVEALLTA